MDSVILEEKIDPNYELTEEEYFEYIESLGIELPEDNDLLYIVHEALKAELPKDWKPCQTKDGQVYYFNFTTGESVWDHPIDTFYRDKIKKAKENRFREQLSEESNSEEISNIQNCSQKKLMIEEFEVYCQKLEKEYLDKKNEEKIMIEQSLEAKKQKILAQFKRKEEELVKNNRQKIENFRKILKKEEQEKEKEMRDKARGEVDRQVGLIRQEYLELLAEEKKKVELKFQNNKKTEKKDLDEKSLLDIKQLSEQIEKFKGKLETEVQVGSTLKVFYEEKLEKKKKNLEIVWEKDKKTVENEVKAKDEDCQEMNKEDQQKFNDARKALECKLKEFSLNERKEYEKKIEELKKKINEQEKLRNEQSQRIKKEISAAEQELKKDLDETVNKYKAEKSATTQKTLENFRLDLQKSLKSLKSSKKSEQSQILALRSQIESSIKSVQAELASIEAQLAKQLSTLDSLLAEEKLLKAEIFQLESQKKPTKGKVPTLSLTPKDQSIIYHEISPEQIFHIESDLESIKKSISSNFPQIDLEKCLTELQNEKSQIKTLKKSLQKDREKWKNDKILYKANPNKQLYSQLSSIKKIIDNKTEWHNWRVKQIKIIEKFLMNKGLQTYPDQELKLEIWRGANTRVDTEVYSQLPEEDINQVKMLQILKKHTNWLRL